VRPENAFGPRVASVYGPEPFRIVFRALGRRDPPSHIVHGPLCLAKIASHPVSRSKTGHQQPAKGLKNQPGYNSDMRDRHARNLAGIDSTGP